VEKRGRLAFQLKRWGGGGKQDKIRIVQPARPLKVVRLAGGSKVRLRKRKGEVNCSRGNCDIRGGKKLY